ncbi:hypothetical protein HK096_003193 [Nowakowskiella sp. JEL0078]|nr:hypothetical protein HK096_003193 [Nowakowskiella sp. JEL0078]
MQSARLVRCRQFATVSTSTASTDSPTTTFIKPKLPQPKKSRSISTGIIGFLLGVSLSTWAGYVYVQDILQQSSNSLLLSVEDLQKSTGKIKRELETIEKVDSKLSLLSEKAASKNDVEKLKNELLSLVDDIRTEHLKLKVQVEELPLPAKVV